MRRGPSGACVSPLILSVPGTGWLAVLSKGDIPPSGLGRTPPRSRSSDILARRIRRGASGDGSAGIEGPRRQDWRQAQAAFGRMGATTGEAQEGTNVLREDWRAMRLINRRRKCGDLYCEPYRRLWLPLVSMITRWSPLEVLNSSNKRSRANCTSRTTFGRCPVAAAIEVKTTAISRFSMERAPPHAGLGV